jgi:primosomal protein N' (replication factor Y)
LEPDSQLHSSDLAQTYVEVLLPLALPKPYTYIVPKELEASVQFGMRVEVQFGKQKRYAGLVVEIHNRIPRHQAAKPILDVIDPAPIINPSQFQLWQWIARYYACNLGEVMATALPGHLKLASETRIVLHPSFDEDFSELDDKAFLVAEALSLQKELTIAEVQGILQQKTVYPIIKRLLDQNVLFLQEEVKEKFTPKKVACVRLQEPYASQPKLLEEAFELVARSSRQTSTLIAFVQLQRQHEHIRRQDLYEHSSADSTVLKALEKKGIFELYERAVSRIATYEEEVEDRPDLSEGQRQAYEQLKKSHQEKDVVLLHGVTGSGKTRLYIEAIKEAVAEGGQVLYLLPEIALTTQLINRLKKVFADDINVYHSRLSNNEQVELWQRTLEGQPVVMGPRSSLFLPFKNLKLVIVDEEHESSFKQHDPAPRYNGRDTAIYLAQIHEAKTILGTATPALETYYNAKKGKYGLVEMNERYGGVQMPEIWVADLTREPQVKGSNLQFSRMLLDELGQAMERNEQAILFQNRRGYAPVLRCLTCGWTKQCIHCDISLTYHKAKNSLRCHSCGYQTQIPGSCLACGSRELTLRGFGTEKIEDELKAFLPEATIARLDLDTARGKHAHARIINDFEERRIDILVGTQMVTKGLDFENVAVVGILSADQLLQFPDFRSAERAFQLMTQVAGRAGRKKKRGKVILQAMQMDHPVIQDVVNHDYQGFYAREIMERQQFKYPPFLRLIKITLKHQQPETVNRAGRQLGNYLKQHLGSRVQGPAIPYIGRIRGKYLIDLLIKIEHDPSVLSQTKRLILAGADQVRQTKGCSNVRINLDVDPL